MKREDFEDDVFDDGYDEISIDFGKYWQRLKGHWKTVFLWTVVGFVIGCLVALDTPHKYKVTSRLAPELSSTATNRLSSVATLVGLTSTVLGSTDAVYPMVYPEVVNSPAFIADLFPTMVTLRKKGEETQVTLYDYIQEYARKSVLGTLRGLPMEAVDAAKSLFLPYEEEDDSTAVVDPFHFTKDQAKVYKVLSKGIESTIDKKTLIITVSVKMDDPLIAAEVAREVNTKLKDYVITYRTDKAIHDRDYYAMLCDEAKEDYHAAQKQYARYVDSHQGMVMQSTQVERERLRDEMTLKYQLYTSMAQQLQGAEAKVQQETPVFAEVVGPTVPRKSINSRKKIALAFAFLAFCAGIVWVLAKQREE